MFCERLSFKEKILHISGDSLFTTLYNSVARDCIFSLVIYWVWLKTLIWSKGLTLVFDYFQLDNYKTEFSVTRLGTRVQFNYFVSFHLNFLNVSSLKAGNCKRQLLECSCSLNISLMFCLWLPLFLNLHDFLQFSHLIVWRIFLNKMEFLSPKYVTNDHFTMEKHSTCLYFGAHSSFRQVKPPFSA